MKKIKKKIQQRTEQQNIAYKTINKWILFIVALYILKYEFIFIECDN